MIDPDHKGHRRAYLDSGAKLCIHVGIYVLFIFLSTFSRPISCAAGDPVELKGLRYHITSEYLRVVIELSGTADILKGQALQPRTSVPRYQQCKTRKRFTEKLYDK